MKKEVLIIGTGLGGLTTALRLAKKGYNVTMVEKFAKAGGRLNELKKDGFTFDMAPSFFSMSYEFKAFADDCKISLPFEFVELDPLYAVNFSGSKKTYQIYKDIHRLAQEFKDLEPEFEKKMSRYLAQAGRFFHDIEYVLLKKNFRSPLHFLASMVFVPPKYLPKMFRSFWSELEDYFDSREVKEIFSLVAFFLGSTPFETIAGYTLLNYTELVHDGYYNVKGGMYRIVEGLLKELEKENVRIHYNVEITGYEETDNKISAFIDTDGKKWKADKYVVNADAAWFRSKIFKRKKYSEEKLQQMKWSMAPLTIYLGVKGKIENIHHHNYFLGTNFKEYANGIFQNNVSIEKPYYYVNAISKYNPESAPEGCESLFILCPVPDLRYKPDWSDSEQIVNNIIDDLSQRINFDIRSRIVSQTVLTPVEWQNMFNLYKGSGLGLGHDLNQMGGFRPKNFDEQYKNVFYVGSSTVPGTGLPMAVISSQLVTQRIIQYD